MAHDLFLKHTKRNWARNSNTIVVGNEAPPTITKSGKIMLAGMAVATAVGVAFITSPWWLPLPSPARTSHNNLGPHAYHFTRSPSGRIIARPI